MHGTTQKLNCISFVDPLQKWKKELEKNREKILGGLEKKEKKEREKKEKEKKEVDWTSGLQLLFA